MPIKIFIRRKFGSDTETQQVRAQQKAFLRVLPTRRALSDSFEFIGAI